MLIFDDKSVAQLQKFSQVTKYTKILDLNHVKMHFSHIPSMDENGQTFFFSKIYLFGE